MILVSIGCYAQQTISLSLEQCKKMALQQSEDMKIAGNASIQAQYDKDIAFSNYLPNIEGSAMGIYMAPDIDLGSSSLVIKGMYTAGFTVQQPIYAGSKIRTANKLAEIGLKSNAEQERITKAEVIADAENSYWSFIAVLNKIKLVKAYESQLDTLQQQMKVSQESGMITENDYLQVAAKLSEIKYQMLKVKNGANLLRLSLCYVTGLSPETEIIPTDTIIDINGIHSSDLDLSNRPEIKLLNIGVEAGEHQIKMAKADNLPQLGVAAGYTWYGNIKTEGITEYEGEQVPYSEKINGAIFNAIASLSVPIFHWGEGQKHVQKAQIDLENAKYQKEKNTRLMTLEATNALNSLNESIALIDAAEFAMKQANENLRVMKSKYEVQLAPLSDLLAAQAQWQESNSNVIEAKTQYKIYEINYLKAVGRLD
ncbi:TolC family protein [Draconibacterium mangrovi]|uniref:TolC family protein n=1 Tax=Draconibacterium mangrovi TaxID=2697469 RepID=UPI0013D118D3|nr:TolC family protein [Draconibacterium mangrovi]